MNNHESTFHNGEQVFNPKEREMLIYWLLRAYQSGHREGWENTPSVQETMEGLLHVLANVGYDPNLSPKAKELAKREPWFFAERGEHPDRIRRLG